MIFANPAYDVSHNKGAPPAIGSPYESVRKPWSLIGRYHADPVLDVMYAPIGPRLLVTVGHIGAFIGQQIDMQGKIYTVVDTKPPIYTQIGFDSFGNPITFGIDATYVIVDQDIPQWFKRFQINDTTKIGFHSLLLHIGGGRGGQTVSNPAVNEGWPTTVVNPDYVISTGNRWSIQNCDRLGGFNNFPTNPAQPDPPPWFSAGALFRAHDDPDGHPECASPKDQDSGSPVFIDCGSSADPWVFLGCVSGGGSSVVNGYQGQKWAGTQCSMIYLDEENVRTLNGETAPPFTGSFKIRFAAEKPC